MSPWANYLVEHCDDDGRHRTFHRWRAVDVWIFQRDDGHRTAHKAEMPWCFWRDTAERCMEMLDALFPCGTPLPPEVDSWSSILMLWRDYKRLPVVRPEEVKPKPAVFLGGEGILNDQDLVELSEGAKRVAVLLGDGQWHSADAIRMAAGKGGIPASEGLRRARELRDIEGVTLERRRGEGRLFEYRVTRADSVDR